MSRSVPSIGIGEELHINLMSASVTEKNQVKAKKFSFDNSQKGYVPKMNGKAEKNVIIEKNGEFVRCQIADNKKLKKMSVIKSTSKEKIEALKGLFAKKYEDKVSTRQSKSAEAKRKNIKASTARKEDRDVV